jgi:hypothetical protein
MVVGIMKKSVTPKKPSKAKAPAAADLELDPDAWPKFEELVRSAAKMGHKPHNAVAKRKNNG